MTDAFDAAFGAPDSPAPASPGDAFDAAFSPKSSTSSESAPSDSTTTSASDYVNAKIKALEADPRIGTAESRKVANIGYAQGIDNVLHFADPLASYLSSKFPVVDRVNQTLGIPSADQAHAEFVQTRNANDKTYADNPDYAAGKLAGGAIATLPVMGVIGKGVTAGGNALLTAARSSPSLARFVPYAEKAGQFGTGNAQGNPLLRYGSAATYGAGQGATAALLNSAGSDQPVSDQITEGAEFGGVLSGAGRLGMDAARYAAKTGKAISNLLTDAGAKRTAEEVVNNFSGTPVVNLNTGEIVPGSIPTLAEASGNANLASLQRTARDLNPNPFVQREQANANARNQLLSSVAGTPDDIDVAKAARDQAASAHRQQAFANAGEADASSVNNLISRILKGPAGQRDAVSRPLQEIQQKLQVSYPINDRISDALSLIKPALSTGNISASRAADLTEARRLLNSARRGNTSPDDLVSGLSALAKKQKIYGPIDDALKIVKSGDTKFQVDPEQLYGIRQSITDRLSPLAAGTKSDARLAAKQLNSVKDSLDNAIEKAAPGYKNYLQTYSGLSRPVDQMQFLQALKLTDQNGNITLNKVQNALQTINKLRSANGLNPAKSLTGEQIKALTAIRDDLLRAGNSHLGRSLGSNTVQNAATQNLLQSMLPGKVGQFASKADPRTIGATIGGAAGLLTGSPMEGAGGVILGRAIGHGIGSFLHGRNEAVQAELENLLLNPRGITPPATGSLNSNRLLNSSGFKQLRPNLIPLAVLMNRDPANATIGP